MSDNDSEKVEVAQDVTDNSFERCEMRGEDAGALALGCTHVYYRPTSAGGSCFVQWTIGQVIELLNHKRNWRYIASYDADGRKLWLTFVPG